MGCWDAKGCGVCQTCGKIGPGHARRPENIDFLRVLGWHYGSGETIGGKQYEMLLCPHCSKDEKRRVIVKPSIEQDALPLDWGQCVAPAKSAGGHTR